MLIDEGKYSVSISRLKMGNNYKDITRDAIDKLKRSLLEDGQLSPILVDNREESGRIIGGNHQYVAIKELIDEKKWSYGEKVWAVLVIPKDDNHAKMLALKHNTQYDLPLSERLAEWGQSLLDTDYPLIDIPVTADLKETTLLDVMDRVGPSGEEQKEPKEPKEAVCPKCGTKFEI